MFQSLFLSFGLLWSLLFSSTILVSGFYDSNNVLSVRNVPGASKEDTLLALRRTLSGAGVRARESKNKTYMESVSISKAWDGATLFTIMEKASSGKRETELEASVSVICQTCYVTTDATMTFTVEDNLNISQALSNLTHEVESDIKNITTAALTEVKAFFEDLGDDLKALWEHGLHFDAFSLPPVNVSLGLDVPEIPECILDLTFDNMELYVELDVVLDAQVTYSLNLYTSETPIGVKLGDSGEVGVTFTIDLILSADGEIDISSGFHILINDGLALQIALFSNKSSGIVFNGGSIEFLPIELQTADIVLTANLRLGAHIGLDVESTSVDILRGNFTAGSGLEGVIFTDIAQFITNVTAAPESSDCELSVEQIYQFGLGIGGGATIGIDNHTWGPAATAETTIYTTTLGSTCAAAKTTSSASSASTGALKPRAGYTTKTLSSVVTYTGTQCLTQAVNCPAQSQTTYHTSYTSYYTTTVTSGASPTIPPTTQNRVTSKVNFGKNVKDIGTSSGTPTSYNPTSSGGGSFTTSIVTETEDFLDRDNNKLKIGLSIGLGVPFLAALLVLCFCWRRRARRTHQAPATIVQQVDTSQKYDTPESYTPASFEPKSNNAFVSMQGFANADGLSPVQHYQVSQIGSEHHDSNHQQDPHSSAAEYQFTGQKVGYQGYQLGSLSRNSVRAVPQGSS